MCFQRSPKNLTSVVKMMMSKKQDDDKQALIDDLDSGNTLGMHCMTLYGI